MGFGGLVMGVIVSAIVVVIFFPQLDRVYDRAKKHFKKEEIESE